MYALIKIQFIDLLFILKFVDGCKNHSGELHAGKKMYVLDPIFRPKSNQQLWHQILRKKQHKDTSNSISICLCLNCKFQLLYFHFTGLLITTKPCVILCAYPTLYKSVTNYLNGPNRKFGSWQKPAYKLWILFSTAANLFSDRVCYY